MYNLSSQRQDPLIAQAGDLGLTLCYTLPGKSDLPSDVSPHLAPVPGHWSVAFAVE